MFLNNNTLRKRAMHSARLSGTIGGVLILLQRTGLRLMDSLQKRRFQLNVGKNGLASGAFQQRSEPLEVVSSLSLGGFQQKPDASLLGMLVEGFLHGLGGREYL